MTAGPATVSLIAEFTVLPGQEARVRALVDDLTAQVRREPGNLVFEPHVRQDDPATFVVFESYVDAAAFAAHLAEEHGRAFNAAISELVEGGASRLTMLTPLGS